jgi:hypothetical protein
MVINIYVLARSVEISKTEATHSTEVHIMKSTAFFAVAAITALSLAGQAQARGISDYTAARINPQTNTTATTNSQVPAKACTPMSSASPMPAGMMNHSGNTSNMMNHGSGQTGMTPAASTSTN